MRIIKNNMRLLLLIASFLTVSLYGNAATGSGIYVGARGSRIFWDTGRGDYIGDLIGPSAGFDYRKAWNVYAGGRFYVVYGTIDAGQCGRKIQDMEMQARVGGSLGDQFRVTPYTGLGTSMIKHKKKDQDPPCHEWTYADVYGILGIIISAHPSPYFSIGIDGQWMRQVDSWIRVGGIQAIRWELDTESSYAIEMPIQFVFPNIKSKVVQWRFIPFFRSDKRGDATLKSLVNSSRVDFLEQSVREWGIRFEMAFF